MHVHVWSKIKKKIPSWILTAISSVLLLLRHDPKIFRTHPPLHQSPFNLEDAFMEHYFDGGGYRIGGGGDKARAYT